MSTIEQRASEYAKRAFNLDPTINELIRTAYLIGATDQKVIDSAIMPSIVACCDFMPYDWAEDCGGHAVRVNTVGVDSMIVSQKNDDMVFFSDKDNPPHGILITDDILTSNGFVYDEGLGSWRYGVPGNNIINYYPHAHSVDECTDENVVIMSIGNINYVHELQHALVMAGLKDMAKNIVL